jgi:hypothetical protein
MFSDNFESVEFEPPNNDVFYVKEDLRKVLTYFKDCDAISSNNPDIDEQINRIREQGRNFYDGLKMSIVQSNNFETHASNAINYLEILEDPGFDQNHVDEIIQIISDNAEINKEKTEEIIEKYNTIKNDLTEINNENFRRKNNDRRELQLLIEKKDDLVEKLERQKWCNMFFFIISPILFVPLSIVNIYPEDKVFFGSIIFIIEILTLLIRFEFINRSKTNIRKTENEVNKLQKRIDLRDEIANLTEAYKNLNPIIKQMNAFSSYWDLQRNRLEDFNKNLLNITDFQTRRLIVATTKPRWKDAKTSCDNYIRTVRRTIADVDNS